MIIDTNYAYYNSLVSLSLGNSDHSLFAAGRRHLCQKFICGLGRGGGAGIFKHHYPADSDYFDFAAGNSDAGTIYFCDQCRTSFADQPNCSGISS